MDKLQSHTDRLQWGEHSISCVTVLLKMHTLYLIMGEYHVEEQSTK